jgi:glucan phosphoethanolaminetransferase (alkaline phosphatase superfamily)
VLRTKLRRLLVGESPRSLLWLAAPTALAVALDLVLRPRALAAFALQGKAIYASSLLVSAAFWALPSWACARLWVRRSGAAVALLALAFFPIATLAFGGQALHWRVFGVYMGRDTVRLGIAVRGTVAGWLASWGSPAGLVTMLALGALATVAIAGAVRRASHAVGPRPPLLLVATFGGALVTCAVDMVDSRFLQAATPDACFLHGAVHAASILVGNRAPRAGLAVRTPAPLPPLAPSSRRPPNVVVVLLESVRADALCSQPALRCAPFLDEAAPDRIALGRVASQTPNTFAACMVLFSGLAPNADVTAAHTAPVLWEIARAAGYRTAYVTSQNPHYENFGVYTERAGIDHRMTGDDLGGVAQEQLGALDERATEDALRFVGAAPADTPLFVVVQLSNSHAPYRVDPALSPFAPSSDDPLGDVSAFKNRYLNSVRLVERTLARFISDLRALPSWDDTAVVVVSDHGEQFREHGSLYHNHSLAEEELAIPGFIVAGARVLGDDRRAALATFAGTRTYMQDIHATVVDLLGVDHGTLPFVNEAARSLLRPRPPAEPLALIATSTAVWDSDEPFFGAIQGERTIVGTESGSWECRAGRGLQKIAVAPWCATTRGTVERAFPTRFGVAR